MSETIDQEAKQRLRLAIDINFLGDRYTTENGIYTFPSPTLETIDQHLYYLLKNSVQKPLERKYFMRPDYLSYDEYGTVQLAYLLMYVNGVRSIEDFQLLGDVVVPAFSAIIEMLKDKFSIKDVSDLQEVNW